MYHVSFILVLFLYQLSVGIILTLACMPLKVVDRKFYQLSSGLASILMMIGLGFALARFVISFVQRVFNSLG